MIEPFKTMNGFKIISEALATLRKSRGANLKKSKGDAPAAASPEPRQQVRAALW